MSLEILIYAVVALGLFAMLFRALGTRHGSEPVVRNPFVEQPATEKSPEPVIVPSQEVVIDPSLPEDHSADTQQALFQMALIDRGFNAGQFVANAKEAYRIVVEAFANDDKATLQDLLAPPVYGAFKQALDQRAEAGETLEAEIRAITKADIVEARVSPNGEGFIKLRLASEQLRVTRGKDGQIVDGHEQRTVHLVDEWTFSRVLKNQDPRWFVQETEDGDPSDGVL